jgi:hypothetical protein
MRIRSSPFNGLDVLQQRGGLVRGNSATDM